MPGAKTTRYILLSGTKGVGKTKILHDFCKVLEEKQMKTIGFYTIEAFNEQGKHIGFDVVTLDGTRGRLARTSDALGPKDRSNFKVGDYLVFVNEFEDVVLPILSIRWLQDVLFIIDEIGSMQMLSEEFVKLTADLFTVRNVHVVATVAEDDHSPLMPLVQELTNDPKNTVVNVTVNNRDTIVPFITTHIMDIP